MPLFTVLLSEISQAAGRGKRFTLTNFAFVLGELLTIIIAFNTLETLESGNWRLMILLSGSLAVFPLIFLFVWGFESPRFLLNVGEV